MKSNEDKPQGHSVDIQMTNTALSPLFPAVDALPMIAPHFPSPTVQNFLTSRKSFNHTTSPLVPPLPEKGHNHFAVDFLALKSRPEKFAMSNSGGRRREVGRTAAYRL